VGVIVIVVAVLILWAVGAQKGNVLVSTKNTTSASIKIGADFALSGNAARYGEWSKAGVQLAVDELNAKGGVLGRPLQVIYEDNKGDVAAAVSAYQKLKNVDDVQAVLTFLSSVGLAVEKQANVDKIIQVDVTSTTPDYSLANGYSVRTAMVATDLAKYSAETMAGKLHAKYIATVTINNDFGKGMLKSFKANWKGALVGELAFDQNEKDFRTLATKVKALPNVDYIFLVGHLNEAGTLVRQMRELGVKTPIFTDVFSIEGPEFLETAGSAAEGIIYAAPKFDANDQASAVASFSLLYRAKYNQDPVIIAAQAYDGIKALKVAWEKCKKTDSGCVKSALREVDFEGASGHIKFDEKGDVSKEVFLKQIKNGQFIRVE